MADTSFTSEIGINPQLLTDLGLGQLPKRQQQQLLRAIYEVLELRVGNKLGPSLDGRELETFERIVKSGNDERAISFLSSAIPEHKSVTVMELQHICDRLMRALVTAHGAQTTLETERDR